MPLPSPPLPISKIIFEVQTLGSVQEAKFDLEHGLIVVVQGFQEKMKFFSDALTNRHPVALQEIAQVELIVDHHVAVLAKGKWQIQRMKHWKAKRRHSSYTKSQYAVLRRMLGSFLPM